MKILFVTGNYLPGKNGGIENYTHLLVKLLLENEFEVEVAALDVDEKSDYFYEGVKVNFLRGSILSFENLIKSGQFDICHFHEYSEFGGIEIPWFLLAKEYCHKVFFTFHLPYLTCYKNDFRYKGVEDCNTFNMAERCTECVIADRGGYKKMNESGLYLSSLMTLMKLIGKKDQLEKKIIEKYQKLIELIAICDNIFIYASWFKKILKDNGYDLPNIKKIPYKTKSIGLSNTTAANAKNSNSGIKNKILFVGRIQYQKGLHLLCNAMNRVETKNISLDVYGNIVEQKYFENCKRDYSFKFKGTTNYFQLLENLKEYDFLVLPSVFTEMYSLIIKDAFYEKLPVIASSAKGNRDAINDGVNGFLFGYDNAKDLAKTIDKAYQLKQNGWVPEFSYSDNPEKDIEEIVSYYK
ncbi:MAG: glycosyltransferase [Ginsengibacter sp.]